MGAHAQFRVTAHQEGWDRIPPQAQKDGFWFQQSVLANMDDGRRRQLRRQISVLSIRTHANLLFTNWLNYYVYQATPFNIEDIKNLGSF